MLGQTRYKRARSIITDISITGTPTSIPINGKDCKIFNLTGTTRVNPLGTATAGAGSLVLAPGTQLELNVEGNLSLLSDTTSTAQIIIFE